MEARLSKATLVAGMLRDADVQCLLDYAEKVTDDIVEIGSYQGRSAIAFAEACHPDVSVICVDPFVTYTVQDAQGRPFEYQGDMNYNAFKANIARHGVAHKIEHIRLPSVDAAKAFSGQVGLLFVDARHEYEHVKADFEGWQAHLVNDAFVIFHDYGDEDGVTAFVNELVKQDDGVAFVERRGLCAVLQVTRIEKPKPKKSRKRKAKTS